MTLTYLLGLTYAYCLLYNLTLIAVALSLSETTPNALLLEINDAVFEGLLSLSGLWLVLLLVLLMPPLCGWLLWCGIRAVIVGLYEELTDY